MPNTSGITSKTLTSVGTISSADITGTAAGQLGHSQGYVLVPAYGSDTVVELVSAILELDYDTAAYTGGGNTTVNISGGGSAVTGIVGNSSLVTGTSDKIVQLVPLAATNIAMTANKGLALVSASAPTQPGTAAGVIHYRVMYRVHKTNL